MALISFGALPCSKRTRWQLASRCCWNRAGPWQAPELVSFLVGLRIYQHPVKIFKMYYFVNIIIIINTVLIMFILSRIDRWHNFYYTAWAVLRISISLHLMLFEKVLNVNEISSNNSHVVYCMGSLITRKSTTWWWPI